jgi:hypothetical protein
MSIGPWPMSVLPCHEPISVFIRSNSGEPIFPSPLWGEGGCKPDEVRPAEGRGELASSAFNHTALASSNVAQTELIVVFIVFLSFLVICSTFIYTTNEPTRSGQDSSLSSSAGTLADMCQALKDFWLIHNQPPVENLVRR